VKFFVENWILILVAFVSGGMLVWPLVRKGGAGGAVSTGEAVRLINREKGVLVDVSEPHEFAAGHAAGARNVPLGQLESSKDLPSNKALPLLVMCPSGARAGRAAAMLRKAGYERAFAVAGGTNAWRDAQLPVERADAGKEASKESAKGAAKLTDKAGDKAGDKAADPSPEQAAEKSA
jgi:rhodanese-related sulfurtransferase